eukprot:TRINITY_DN5109_c0_g4_i1.p1 TRINITY_DN5109_c0_g4~~TRINITY_DN5109_c0_g4_i1.p1  ORF type:complete len:662 (+),score=135.01 TRINITY_DN5109_c0_g4_i1:237-1988(+)
MDASALASNPTLPTGGADEKAAAATLSGVSAGSASGSHRPRRSLRAHSSDPSWEAPERQVVQTTPGRFRSSIMNEGTAAGLDRGLLDFVIDVSFDMREYHCRMAAASTRRRSADAGGWQSQSSLSAALLRTEAAEVEGDVENRASAALAATAAEAAGASKLAAIGDGKADVGTSGGARRLSSDVATVLVILKSFTGSTLLVAPAEFLQAGLLAGNLLFWGIGLLELVCMLKLLRLHQKFGGSFGQLAYRAMGPIGTLAVDGSIVVSQLGFTAVEMIYVAHNGAVAVRWLLDHLPFLATMAQSAGIPTGLTEMQAALNFLQLLFIIPVGWSRELGALTVFNFIGNVLVFGSLVALAISSTMGLIADGAAPDPPLTCSVGQGFAFLGFSVYTFEGVNMVIPMYEAHANKQSFTSLFSCTIVAIVAIFSGFSFLNVSRYGEQLQPVLTLNMDPHSILGGWIPFAFALASLVLVPLMAFPTYGPIEAAAQKFCPPLVKSKARVDFIRTVLLIGCAVVAQFFGASLQAFLGLVGAVGCMPLALIYPAITHLRLCAQTRAEVVADALIASFGFIVMALTTASVLGVNLL